MEAGSSILAQDKFRLLRNWKGNLPIIKELRKQNWSSYEIADHLALNSGINVHPSTVSSIIRALVSTGELDMKFVHISRKGSRKVFTGNSAERFSKSRKFNLDNNSTFKKRNEAVWVLYKYLLHAGFSGNRVEEIIKKLPEHSLTKGMVAGIVRKKRILSEEN